MVEWHGRKEADQDLVLWCDEQKKHGCEGRFNVNIDSKYVSQITYFSTEYLIYGAHQEV